MHPDVFRKVVWEEMLYAQMRSNYFAELVRRVGASELEHQKVKASR